MNEVQVTMSGAAHELGRSKPESGLLEVTAGEHFNRFYFYDTADVWTADGWLVTAVQDDGVTHHVRKGDQVGRQIIEADEVLHYLPNAKTKRYLAEITAQ